jgi:FecR-like protein
MDERLIEQLREIDGRLGELEPPARLERRVLASTRERHGVAPRMLVLASVVAAVVLAFWLGQRGRTGTPELERAPEQPLAVVPMAWPALVDAAAPPPFVAWEGALTAEPGCTPSGDETLSIPAGCRVRLREPALAIEAWQPTRLAAARNGVRVLEGELLFAVEPVGVDQPRARVEVSGGAIEVIGTRFAVVQHKGGGHVDLLEGSIAFVDGRGQTHAIEQGRRAHWSAEGLVTPPGPHTVSPRASGPRTTGSDALDATLEQVAGLRRAERWREAVELLHDARRGLGDGAGAEILSYEEGTLRAHDEDATAMCAYWRGHLARFGDGDHAPSARSQLARAGCDEL